MMADEEAMRQKKRNRKRQNAVEVAVAPSLSPCPPATLEPRLEYLRPLAGEALSLKVDSAVRGIKREGNQAAAVAPLLEKVEEAGGRQEKKRKRRNRRENASDVPKYENVTIRSGSSSSIKKPRMPSTRKIIRMRAEAARQQPLPQGLLDAIVEAANPSSDSIEQNPNHSSPFGAFFDQFRYIPDRQQNRNPLPIAETPDHLARPLPQCHSSTAPLELNANETPIGAKTTALNVSVSLSQEKVQAKDKEKLRKKVDGNKQRKPKPCLTTPDMCSDKYRRLPLDQLVPPPRSPHKLLQEKYASDPWKVIVICILLNLTQGKQVSSSIICLFMPSTSILLYQDISYNHSKSHDSLRT
jgi:methyl-CpG-binding domain protein 4